MFVVVVAGGGGEETRSGRSLGVAGRDLRIEEARWGRIMGSSFMLLV